MIIMNNILSIKNIGKTYYTDSSEVAAIEDISLEVNKGEFIGIVGPSGCGKSTLLSILNKQLEPTKGYINYNDKTIGYMLQEDALFDWLNVLDNCLLGLKIKNILNKDNKEYVINLLNKYGLSEFIYSYPNNLSGGMRQRVALIRTLASKPDILIMDEPFSALDSQTRLSISTYVHDILKQEEKTLLLVTHNIEEALNLCDKVVVLTKRPSKIKNIYTINNDKDYYNLIWNDLNE